MRCVQVPSTLPAHPLAPHPGHLPEEGQGPLRLQEEQHQRGGTIKNPLYTVKKGSEFPVPQLGCHLPNSPWPRIILIILGQVGFG